ncbi:MAG: hypothetical protein JNK87_12560 [Bryobacterales bacterium]|nr:hypothetical protein [Bryobacterales bacterium]
MASLTRGGLLQGGGLLERSLGQGVAGFAHLVHGTADLLGGHRHRSGQPEQERTDAAHQDIDRDTDEQGQRDQPQGGLQHAGAYGGIDTAEAGPQQKDAVAVAVFPAFHAKSQQIPPVLGRTMAGIAMADQAVRTELDGAGVEDLVGLLIHGEVLLGALLEQGGQDAGLIRIGQVMGVARLLCGNAELVTFAFGDFGNRGPGGDDRHRLVQGQFAEVGGAGEIGL